MFGVFLYYFPEEEVSERFPSYLVLSLLFRNRQTQHSRRATAPAMLGLTVKEELPTEA